MVDMEVVKERLLKGAYVGVGSFGSNFLASFVEERSDVSDIGTSLAQVGTGLSASVAVDQVFDNPESIPNDLVEYAGYGVQGAGWADLADYAIEMDRQGGQMVTVDRRATSRQPGQRVTQATRDRSNEQPAGGFAADIA